MAMESMSPAEGIYLDEADGREEGAPAAAATLDPERWVAAHGDVLFRFALARLRSEELAEDAVQETFLAALRARSRYAGAASERTWLIGILKHKIIDHFRRRSREVSASELDEAPDEKKPGQEWFDRSGKWRLSPAKWRNPRAELSDQEFWEVLNECLDRLPERPACALRLRILDQVPGEEVREILNVSATNLGALIYRARLGLRRCLDLKWFRPAAREGR